jgi:drug/metabolite transporter (DMT)-like permease
VQAQPVEELHGILKIRGLLYMFLSVIFFSGFYILQKMLLATSLASGNPIHPFEWTYWVCLVMALIYVVVIKALKQSFFPIPKNVRGVFIGRVVFGLISNLSFLMAQKFIPFAKASVIHWTMPVFTALAARFYLKEHLSYFDWVGVCVSFLGILLIQNPFGHHGHSGTAQEDLIGTLLALNGSLCGAYIGISVRILTKYSKLDYMVTPMGYALGNLLLCPFFMMIKTQFIPLEPNSMLPSVDRLSGAPAQGSSFHSYSKEDILLILILAVLICCAQIFITEAYMYEKAGRVAPIMYLQIIICCLADIMLFGTTLTSN